MIERETNLVFFLSLFHLDKDGYWLRAVPMNFYGIVRLSMCIIRTVGRCRK